MSLICELASRLKFPFGHGCSLAYLHFVTDHTETVYHLVYCSRTVTATGASGVL